MGNEGSVASGSESSTPLSEYANSMYSLGSKVRSSVESTRAPSPLDAPEPDLSHLTEEEVAKIKAVMERAKVMQDEEQQRVRKLEEEYVTLATKIEREASLTELSEAEGKALCPICTKNPLPPPSLARSPTSTHSPFKVCADCEKLTCAECGSYITSSTTKLQEWVCTLCEKRRKLMMSTGMWYHGYHPEADQSPLAKKVTSQDSQEREMTSRSGTRGQQDLMTASTVSRDSRDSRDSADSRRSDFSSFSAELNLLTMTSSQNSELARHMYEQNKVKGPGASLPKSESDDFSDLASDLDFDEVASERSRPDGSSTEEISRDFCVIGHPCGGSGNGGDKRGERRQKHRPRSLNLPRSHSSTSDEDGEGDDGGEEGGGRGGGGGGGGGSGGGAKGCGTFGRDSSSGSGQGAPGGGDRKDKRKDSDKRTAAGGGLPLQRKDSGEAGGRATAGVLGAASQHPGHFPPQGRSSLGSAASAFHVPQPSSHASLPSFTTASSSSSLSFHNPHFNGQHSGPPPPSHALLSMRDPNAVMPPEFVETSKVNSPTPPRSPSWREGLESPPFSPRRRDSYPGKRPRSGSPVSPKDSKLHFTYGDLSPPSRHRSLEDLCDLPSMGAAADYGTAFGQHISTLSHRLSPKSPDEMHRDGLTSSTTAAAGQSTTLFQVPATRGAKTGSSTLASSGLAAEYGLGSGAGVTYSSDFRHRGGAGSEVDMLGLPHSAPVMDLATYAASVANSTACLTSMSVSPTTVRPQGAITSHAAGALRDGGKMAGEFSSSSFHSRPHLDLQGSGSALGACAISEPLSPDSMDSTPESASPVSPGYYENASSTSTDDVDELDLADPSSKPIDMGSGKRQKARPPSTDWSPVIDLSPILDVSPSVEEAEQEDMLAKQREELQLQRQRSRDESDLTMDEEDDDEEDEEDEDVTMFSMSNSMSSSQDQGDVTTNPFAFKAERRSGEDSSDGQEMMDLSTYSSLRRYGNLEDISQIGSSSTSSISRSSSSNNNSDADGGVAAGAAASSGVRVSFGAPTPKKEEKEGGKRVYDEQEEALIYQVATEAAGAAIRAALEETRRLAQQHSEDENGNQPSPNEDAPFCTSLAQPAGISTSLVTTSAPIASKTHVTASSGGAAGGGEEDARSQRKALEAHISDEISRITQGMEDIVRRGAADVKPIPPPKPRRRLPEPNSEMSAIFSSTTSPTHHLPIVAPAASVSPSLRRHKMSSGSLQQHHHHHHHHHQQELQQPQHRGARGSDHEIALPPPARRPSPRPPADRDALSGSTAAGSSETGEDQAEGILRQDSAEKRKAKDLKARPSPLLIQHIEAEEQSVSPHYRVMDSPPTPDHKLMRREFSESTSVSPSSSPDNDQYMFPSPVTPPDSDSSPPKPHSPSSAGTDLEEEGAAAAPPFGLEEEEEEELEEVDIARELLREGRMRSLSQRQDENSLLALSPPYDPFRDVSPLGFGDFAHKDATLPLQPALATEPAASGRKRVPPPVPVRSKASAPTGSRAMEVPRALPPPPVPTRSESLDSSEGFASSEEGEGTASVRDKIRAFELNEHYCILS